MTKWPSDQVTEWPSDRVTEWLSDQVTKWPSDQVTEWPSDQVTKWPSDRVTEWPSDRVTEWPSDQVTEWQEASQTIDRMVYLYYSISVPVSAYSHKSREHNIMFDTSLDLCVVMTAAVWIVPFWTYIYPTAPVGTASQHKKNLFYCNFAKMIYKSRRKMVLFCLHPE